MAGIILTAVFANIGLNIYFVPQYGYQAAAYTTFISFVIMSILSYGTTKHLLKINTHFLPRILKYFIYLSILVAIFYAFFPRDQVSLWAILAKGILFLVLAYLIFRDKLNDFLRSDD